MKDIILKPGTFLQMLKTKWSQKFTPGISLETFVLDVLKADSTCCPKSLVLTKGTVTQATSISTGVTLNKPSGVITTVALTTAANTVEAGFTVTNSYVTADSVIIATVVGYSGATVTNDLPTVYVDDIAAGSFKVFVGNGGSGTLDGTVKIAFTIL